MRRILSTLLALALVVTTSAANAFIGLLYGEAKVSIKTEHQFVAGLDEQTRRLIQGLAPQIRGEAIQFLRDAVPILDEGTAQFLNRLDTFLENRINGLVCSGQGLAKGLAEELGAAWRNERPKPLLELAQDFDARKGFDPKTAKYITLSYYDFLHNAAITSCQLADSDAKTRVEKMRAEARKRARVWEEIEGRCASPSECLTNRYAEISQLVATSDARDIQNAGATAGLAAVRLVQPKSGVLPWLNSLFGRTGWVAQDANWVSYETELVKLHTIARSIEFTRNLRQQTAKARYNTALASIASAEGAIVPHVASVGMASAAVNTKAEQDAKALIAGQTSWTADLNSALAGDGTLKTEVDGALQRIKALNTSVATMTTQVVANNAAIAAREAERLRRAQERSELLRELRTGPRRMPV